MRNKIRLISEQTFEKDGAKHSDIMFQVQNCTQDKVKEIIQTVTELDESPEVEIICRKDKKIQCAKPPIGIKPRYIHDLIRCNEIAEAISRYTQANVKIPLQWVAEYNEIIDREHRRTK